MKIRKITETTIVNGLLEETEKYHVQLVDNDEGRELEAEELKNLYKLIDRVVMGRVVEPVEHISFNPNTWYKDLHCHINNLSREEKNTLDVVAQYVADVSDAHAKAEYEKALDQVHYAHEQRCRVCGCTWYDPCEGGCSWVEEDLCSKCASEERFPYDHADEPEIITETDYGTPDGDMTATVTAEITDDEINVLHVKVDEPESYENLTKLEDKSKDTVDESAKPVKEKKPKKAARDYSKYIRMYESGVDPNTIKKAIQDDLVISNLTAEQYFYKNVKSVGKKPKAPTKKKVDPEIFNYINDMIYYHTPQQFKDACVAADIGRGTVSVAQLKEVYLETHPDVRW